MSFTTDVCEELLSLHTDKNCCKKALLCGLLFCAKAEPDTVCSVFKTARAAESAMFLLETRYASDASVEEISRAGRKYYKVAAECHSLAEIIRSLDGEDTRPLWELLNFKCGNCRAHFLRGVFVACATLNDPQKGYHLELSMPFERRSQRLADILSVAVFEPKRLMRGANYSLYYKTNGAISDFVYYIGGTRSSFDVANTWVERDIRNNENRATNCVARNISRSVDASRNQITAIERLIETGRFHSLTEELKVTASLRLENPSASLTELARMHTPPISKSGLNQRLLKILAAAEDAGNCLG